ncbi:MAG: ferritin family protein [Planctomycetota bacterium]
MPENRPTHEQLITQLKYAIEQEWQTYLRYSEAARLVGNEKVQELLLFLAKEEQVHEEKLQRMLDEIEANAPKENS